MTVRGFGMLMSLHVATGVAKGLAENYPRVYVTGCAGRDDLYVILHVPTEQDVGVVTEALKPAIEAALPRRVDVKVTSRPPMGIRATDGSGIDTRWNEEAGEWETVTIPADQMPQMSKRSLWSRIVDWLLG